MGKKSAMLYRPDLFFAFVDLKWQSGQSPVVFIIPSEYVYKSFQDAITKYFGGHEDKVKRWRFHPGVNSIREFENKWDLLWDYLKEKAQPSTT